MKRILIITAFLLIFYSTGISQITLPKLVSDGMVLQRDAVVTIWGWASEGEHITISFMGEVYNTTTDSKGNWSFFIEPMAYGGPHTMQIEASNSITIRDILIGDVWVASGQSNMELRMRDVWPLYEKEIATADYANIRYFDVPQQYDFHEPWKDVDYGNWEAVNQLNIRDISAAAYFFAKNIYEEHGIPVGIIHNSLGGSPAQSWMSEEALKTYPDYYNELQQYRDDEFVANIIASDRERIENWYQTVDEQDKGHQERQGDWYRPNLNTDDWLSMEIPGYWADTEIGPMNGVVWFRRTISLPEEANEQAALLELGSIVDADSVFVNGTYVGNTTYMYPPRWYDVPEGVLQEGENTIAIRIINERGRGGFIPDKPYRLILDTETIDLRGHWKFKPGVEMNPLGSQTFVRWKSGGLFNAMLAPLFNYTIQGVIWYQGESNTGRAEEYRSLFPDMIQDWREHWGQGDFPFIYVQLAGYMAPSENPVPSQWAMLREAQLQSLSVPNTAMAVAMDIGEWNDIHPLNKKDVGDRLALAARNMVYGENIVYSGPLYSSMEIEGNKITLSFDHIGSGLMVNGEKLQEFAIAGEDQNFVWANARIEGNKVVVWSEEVSNPVAVRYAWADFAEKPNLFNKEGLPASPFRTDNWDK